MDESSLQDQPTDSCCVSMEGMTGDEDNDDIDIVGIKIDEQQESCEECSSRDNQFALKEECQEFSESCEDSKGTREQEARTSTETVQQRGLSQRNKIILSTNEHTKTDVNAVDDPHGLDGVCKDDLVATDISNTEGIDVNMVNEEESWCPSPSLTSTYSSKASSRRNSVTSSETSKRHFENQELLEQGIMYSTGQDSCQLSDDEADGQHRDPYERFFFESDYLALKDNRHYHLLLQTLVALEGQRIQAIKDLDTLCEEEAKALDDPIGFVERLQNNEPIGLPTAQQVIKLPNIPWEVYASSLGPVDTLPAGHLTRASSNHVEKAAHSAVQNCAAQSSLSSSPPNVFSAIERPLTSKGDSDTIFSDTSKNNIMGSRFDPNKLPTFNQPWTTEEQTRLEKLLEVHPQEEIESKRWEKIAKALGNRTPKQVASRIQKYFIKLAKAGLPVPGRVPNLPRSGARTSKKASHYKTLGFRNSTFFPSYQPRVYMDDNRDDDDESSAAFSDDASYQSDDEHITEELRQTHEYKELLELKKLKRKKLFYADQMQQDSVSHSGFMCDGCGASPIVDVRWHCQDCPRDNSVDFCSPCVEKEIPESRGHSRQHRLEPVTRDSPFFVDGDYVAMNGSASGYNYLDPNFLPAAS